jgi:hypothetical protein
MFKGVVVLAVALQLARGTAPDGLIHITCTIPPDYNGGFTIPGIVSQIIVNPSQNTAWIDRACGGSYN